jgi:hypothetical protein
MSKYRKKPVVIEAYQWDNQKTNVQDWPDWLVEALNTRSGEAGCLYNTPSGWKISTLEGHMEVSSDDFIIRGVQGELYPCKPDIFDATYERVKVDRPCICPNCQEIECDDDCPLREL